MKFLLLFVFVAVALADMDSMLNENLLSRNLASAFKINLMDASECVRKSAVTQEDLLFVESVNNFTEAEATNMKSLKRASCVLVCSAQKAGVMVGGDIQLDKLDEFFQKIGIPEERKSPLRTVVRMCKEQVTDTSDECMAGYTIVKCLGQYSL